MLWQKPSAPEQAPAPPRPYQGVRVKEPVKELLRRKRGHASSGAAVTPTAVVLPHQPLATYTAVGPSCLDMEVSASTVTEEGALCAGWLSQPAPATLQPLAPWTPYTEYVPHEAVSCPYSADMYVQPMCPSYTVVGPSSVLTYASQPLITNVTQVGDEWLHGDQPQDAKAATCSQDGLGVGHLIKQLLAGGQPGETGFRGQTSQERDIQEVLWNTSPWSE
ncbi:POU domain class 2-associating factor 1 [Crocuta crocuta]